MKTIKTIELFKESNESSFEYEIKIMTKEENYTLIEKTETYAKLQIKIGYLTDVEIMQRIKDYQHRC